MSVGRSSSSSARRHRWVPEPAVDPDVIPDASHGGVPPGRYGEPVVDLSLSTNPFGPPPFLSEILADAGRDATRYPDRSQKDLCAWIEEERGLDSGWVVAAGSASELLRAVITGFGTGRNLLLPRFTYEEYQRIGLLSRARVGRVPMPDFHFPPSTAAKHVQEESMVLLPNPGTPFAHYLSPKEFQPLVEAVERRHAILVVDESYLPFVRGGKSMAGVSPSIVTVSSWSKVLGTPGIPFGHASGHPAVLKGIKAQLLPWSVGAVNRSLAVRALATEGKWRADSLAQVAALSEEVRKRLHATTRANYFAVESVSARKLTQDLLKRGFAVRDLTALGLPRHIRFGVRTPEETRRFLDVLEELLGKVRAE